MNSIIVWVLVVMSPSGYCLSTVEISFKTESECVSALDGVDKYNRSTSQCVPRKAKE